MSKPCIVCAEAGVRDSVDRQLAEHVPIRQIASVVDRSKSAIPRHKLDGSDERDERSVKLSTPEAPKAVKDTTSRRRARPSPSAREELSQTGHQAGQEPIETREHLVERFQKMLDEAMAILTEARRRRDNRLALASLKEARESMVSIGKALGLVQPDGATFIDQRRQGLLLLGKLSDESLDAAIARLMAGGDAAVGDELVGGAAIDVEHRAVTP